MWITELLRVLHWDNGGHLLRMNRSAVSGVTRQRSSPKSTPGVKLTLQALYVGQKVDDVQVGVVLLGGNSGCRQVVRYRFC